MILSFIATKIGLVEDSIPAHWQEPYGGFLADLVTFIDKTSPWFSTTTDSQFVDLQESMEHRSLMVGYTGSVRNDWHIILVS
jgi:hypothetical protein